MQMEDHILSEAPLQTGNDLPVVRVVRLIAREDAKVYDGTQLSSQVPVVIGELADDHLVIVTQRFKDKNVGETVLVPEVRIIDRSGRSMEYDISIQHAAGRITPRPLMVWAESDTKEYDGTTLSMMVPQVDNLIDGDMVVASQAFDTPEIGIHKTITAKVGINGSNNYEIILYPVHTGSITTISAGNQSEALKKVSEYLDTDDFMILAAGDSMDFVGEVCYSDEKKIYLKLEARKRVQMVIEMERIHQGLQDAEVGKKLHVVVKGKEVKAQPSGHSSSSPRRGRH